MNNIFYILRRCVGSYDTYGYENLAVYTSEEEAEAKCAELNAILEVKIDKYFNEVDKIGENASFSEKWEARHEIAVRLGLIDSLFFAEGEMVNSFDVDTVNNEIINNKI